MSVLKDIDVVMMMMNIVCISIKDTMFIICAVIMPSK